MVAVVKTNELIDNVNKIENNANLYVTRKDDASSIIVDWNKKKEIHWEKYQIKETDMRVKTATFTSPQYLDLTTGQYCLLISSPMHEDFGGVILNVEYDDKNDLYSYQCQDFSRFYQSKFELINNGKYTNYRVLQYLLTQGGIPLKGKITKKMKKKYKKELSGLRPKWQYQQGKEVGNTIKYNPMDYKNAMIMRNKSYIEAIRDLSLGVGAFYDVYFDKYGVPHIEPYHRDDLLKSGLTLTTPEIASKQYKFDTTNILTGTLVHSSNKLKNGKLYTSEQVINLDLSAFFGKLYTSMDSESSSTSTSSSNKQSTDKSKNGNPYGTKKKALELSFDNYKNSSTDKAFVNDLKKLLKKNGWKVTKSRIGSNMHTEKHMKIKNGVHFCVMNGVDAGMIREVSINSSYVKKQKKLNCRTVWAWIRTDPKRKNDIRKGGNSEHWIVRGHDDNYSPSGFNGIKEPRKKLIKAKVPFMYGKDAKEIVSKFCSGGDEKECL